MSARKLYSMECGREAEEIVRICLSSLGFEANLTDEKHPFDIIVTNKGKEVAGVEVKYIGNGVVGTRISKEAIKRKQAYAKEHGLIKLYTMIVNEMGEVGWLEGIRNAPASIFERSLSKLQYSLAEVIE